MKKIIVLGSKGMLGQMVTKFFSKSYEVITVDERYTFENRLDFLSAIKDAGEGFVVNCIGKIKQKTDDLDDLLWVNATLPLDLKASINTNQFLIHPSTDCVYSGTLKEGMYAKSLQSNATDEYGWSKFMGEQALIGAKRSIVVRVSIIGPDHISPTPKGLLGWFLSNPKGADLKGYSNHLWNGITTLEWCKQVHRLIESGDIHNWEGRLLQLGTREVYSKKQMLDIFQSAYKTDYSIAGFETDQSINRCLVPDINAPELEEQMNQLATFFN